MSLYIKIDGNNNITYYGKSGDIAIISWPQIDNQPARKSECYWTGSDVALKSEWLEYQKLNKSEEISEAFTNDLSDGHFSSTVLGIEVDCRRTTTKNDLQNVQGLLSYMTRNSITDVIYKGYQNQEKTGVTVANLETLANEMEDHVFALYNKKWTKQAAIEAASTVSEVEAISW